MEGMTESGYLATVENAEALNASDHSHASNCGSSFLIDRIPTQAESLQTGLSKPYYTRGHPLPESEETCATGPHHAILVLHYYRVKYFSVVRNFLGEPHQPRIILVFCFGSK